MSKSDNNVNSPQSTAQDSRIVDEAIDWFGRLRADDVTIEERQAFERWCQQDPMHERAFRKVNAAWDHPIFKTAARRSAESTDHLNHVPATSWLPSYWHAIGAAAILVLFILAAEQWDLFTRLQADYYTSVGERRTIELPDHSTLTMNTRTAVAIRYEDHTRKVHLLQGQAFFRVAPDTQRPFIVEHNGITTRAVGTEFDVQTQSSGVQVTVVEGLVQVSEARGSWPHIALEAGKQVRVQADRSEEPHSIEVHIATGWLRNRLTVTSALLGDVIDEVRRYYPGTIIIANPQLRLIHVTGTYHLNEPAALLATLSKTLPFHMVAVTDRLTILY
ncbi:hypothetical protein W02_10620 [Nitrospira sp. KM1]|uniref:FecR family protein n=1 Tax=Nitrospira sp. KM1 TaxID=1936990 RepID=UPI0013A7758B|nr:FecR family protein [Nitrospira sp. KM1]BCA53922.1 hypothetical protein W02_10620 [Nitrospira sp. KM1]